MKPLQQTELHRHLDVSVRTSTLLKLAQERGLEPLSTSVEQFREKLILREPFTDLNAVLAQFAIFQQVLDRPEVMEQVTYEVIEDCRLEGTRQVELRFSPSFVCEFSHLKWEDALHGFEAGMKRALQDFSDMRAGLICIATRDYGPEVVDQTVEFFLKNQDRFVGLDLAGDEENYPCHLFEKSFQKTKARGARVTVHAGEASGPENIWEAIELLGAERIGHGVSCVQDPRLMDFLAKKKVCLEMCPTSNWLTGIVKDLKDHPLPQVLRSGIPVCFNTDDPGMFGVTVAYEMNLGRQKMGLTQAEIDLCTRHAMNASFIQNSY